MLITSRRRLADLETDDCLSLDVLPPKDGLALVTRLASARRVAAGPQDAQDVVRLCGYVPLAIRIAGARLRARPAWSMAHLAQRLREEQGRLAEQRLFRLTASWTGSPSAVYIRTADHAVKRLYALRMQLPRPPADASVRARAFDDDQEALSWLNAQRLNLVAAVQHAADHDLHPVAYHLADAIRSHLFYQRHDAELRRVAQARLRAAHASGDRDAQATLYSTMSGLAWYVGDTRLALQHLIMARTAARDDTSPDRTATILAQFGLVYIELGRLDDAVENIQSSLAIHERCADAPGIGRVQAAMGKF